LFFLPGGPDPRRPRSPARENRNCGVIRSHRTVPRTSSATKLRQLFRLRKQAGKGRPALHIHCGSRHEEQHACTGIKRSPVGADASLRICLAPLRVRETKRRGAINGVQQAGSDVMRIAGMTASFEEAEAELKENWAKWLAWAKLQEISDEGGALSQ
jgi:hypothetical protein